MLIQLLILAYNLSNDDISNFKIDTYLSLQLEEVSLSVFSKPSIDPAPLGPDKMMISRILI